MIAKRVAMRSLKKSNFAELVSYITNDQNKHERLGEVKTTNCHADAASDAIFEVQAVQQLNQRATSDKTYHLIISFRDGENPSTEVLADIERRIAEGLGYGEHQRISAVHYDTDNVHMHLAINKIHPKKHTIHAPYNDFKELARLCEELEIKHALEQDNHLAKQFGVESAANEMEKNAGIESLLGWIKRTCLEDLQAARSWPEFHEALACNGLEIRKRGNGFVIVSASDDASQVAVKASSVCRDFSKPKLEQRFGAYQEAEQPEITTAEQPYKSQPFQQNNLTEDLYAQYQVDQERQDTLQFDKIGLLVAQKDKLIASALRRNALRRATIKLTGADRMTKKLLYHQAYKALQRDKQRIHSRYRSQRYRLYQEYRRQAWSDWLCTRAISGNEVCLATLRLGENAKTQKSPNHFSGTVGETIPKTLPKHSVIDGITKQGTIVYRVGDSVLRETSEKLQVFRLATREDIKKIVEFAHLRFGKSLSFNGDSTLSPEIAKIVASENIPCRVTKQDQNEAVENTVMIGAEAAKQYIHERHQKRKNGLDISNHKLYNDEYGVFSYAGTRIIGGQALALLKDEKADILVIPVDSSTANRLKRVNLGGAVSVDKGTIRIKSKRLKT